MRGSSPLGSRTASSSCSCYNGSRDGTCSPPQLACSQEPRHAPPRAQPSPWRTRRLERAWREGVGWGPLGGGEGRQERGGTSSQRWGRRPCCCCNLYTTLAGVARVHGMPSRKFVQLDGASAIRPRTGTAHATTRVRAPPRTIIGQPSTVLEGEDLSSLPAGAPAPMYSSEPMPKGEVTERGPADARGRRKGVGRSGAPPNVRGRLAPLGPNGRGWERRITQAPRTRRSRGNVGTEKSYT